MGPDVLIATQKISQEESASMARKVRGYRRHPVGMKQQVVGRMQAGENITALGGITIVDAVRTSASRDTQAQREQL
jgi:hypothetical protein